MFGPDRAKNICIKKFVLLKLNLYSRTHVHLGPLKVFSIIVGNLLKICIFVSTITKTKKDD